MKALTSIYNIDYQPILHHHPPPPFGHLLYLRGGVFIRFRIFTHPPLCVKDTVFALSYNQVELRSNSFTLGNAHASMALLSLNHDLICPCGAGTRPDFYDFGKVAQPIRP